MTLDQLRKRSDFHRVERIGHNAFEIWAANDTEECRQVKSRQRVARRPGLSRFATTDIAQQHRSRKGRGQVNFKIPTDGIQVALRAAVAAGISVAIAQFLKLEHPIYAFIAAVIATDLSPSQSAKLGMRRVIATIVGAICGAILTPILPPGPFAVGSSILVAMLICELLRSPESSRVAGFICGIIVFSDAAEPWVYSYFRFIETVLGVGIAWLISYVPKLIKTGAGGQG